jgi:hypothetical protein
MENSIYNFCWEFCYEIATADPKGNEKHEFIMNLPIRFLPMLKTRLDKAGFRCASIKLHGRESVLARFQKKPYLAKS